MEINFHRIKKTELFYTLVNAKLTDCYVIYGRLLNIKGTFTHKSYYIGKIGRYSFHINKILL